MLEAPIECVHAKAEWVGTFVPTQQLEQLLPTARSTAVRHTLNILMPSRNQIQADPAAEHTHDCLLGSRESAGEFGNSWAHAPGAVMLAVWQWLVP